MYTKTIFSICLLFISIRSFSQDPLFSQTVGGNFNLNSALAGNDSIGRLSANYRNQWIGITGNYITNSINFQQYIPKLDGFGGINFLEDNAANTIKSSNLSIFYSQNIHYKNVLIRPSLEVGFGTKKIDISNLTFGDMIDPRKGFIYTSDAIINKTNVNFLYVSSGAIFYWKNLLLGASTHHLNSPKTSFTNTQSTLTIRYDFQFSYCFKINNLRISPFIYYSQQKGFQATVAGVNLKTKKLFNFSISNRINDAVILNIGYSNRRFSINYSFDQTISTLAYTGNTHELSIAFKFWKVNPIKKFTYIESVYN